MKGFECMKARVRVSGKRGSSELTSPVVPSFSGGSEPVTRLKNPPYLSLSCCSRLPPKAQPAPASAENPEFLLFAGSTIGDRITFSCTPVSAQPDLVGDNSIKVFEKSFSWIWQTRLVVPELLMDNAASKFNNSVK